MSNTAIKQLHIKAEECLSDEETAKLGGTLLTDDSYTYLVQGEDTDVYKPDGSILCRVRYNVIAPAICAASYSIFREAATPTNNRGMAAGTVVDDPDKAQNIVARPKGTTTGHRLKKDGTVSNTSIAKKSVDSGIVGYFDRSSRFPYCRLTAYNLNHPEKFRGVLPMVRRIDELFKELMPERYSQQLEVVKATSPDFYISGTAFTTITVNRNFQTAVHQDQGDLKEGFGVMTVMRAGKFQGCFTAFPKFKVAVDMQTGCLFLADVHEWHGNTPVRGTKGMHERVSLVLYYREKMQECGSAQEELDRVKVARGHLFE